MKTKLLLSVILLAVAMSVASAGPIVFSRPINNTPGNIITYSPPNYTQYILGDDFALGSTTVIDSLTVGIASATTSVTNPNQENSAIKLYLGADPGPLNLASSSYTFAPAGVFANPNTKTNQNLFAITFSGLNFKATAGTLYDFGVEGIPTNPAVQLALVATPCANLNGPCPGDGADGIFLAFTGTPGAGPYNLSFTTPSSGTAGVADIDVSLQGPSGVPEPSSFALLGLGFGAFAWLRRGRA